MHLTAPLRALALVAITSSLLICQDEPTARLSPPVGPAADPVDLAAAPLPGPGALAISGDTILVGGQPSYLWSAELPYYRLAREEWPDRLAKVAAAGIRFVTAYVPWNLHEYRDGTFDFTGSTGEPRRDLVGFIEAARHQGMGVILKPGPFICAEVQHGGIPDWLTRAHPAILARDWRGRLVGFRQDGKPLPDFLDPAYLSYVKRWYRALFDGVLSRFQSPRGPVTALQVDNEIPYSTSGLSDPSPGDTPASWRTCSASGSPVPTGTSRSSTGSTASRCRRTRPSSRPGRTTVRRRPPVGCCWRTGCALRGGTAARCCGSMGRSSSPSA